MVYFDLNNIDATGAQLEGFADQLRSRFDPDTLARSFVDGVNRELNGTLPRTRARLNHGLLIRFKGRGVGAVMNFSVTQAVQVKEEFELTVDATGDVPMTPNHLAIQVLSGRTIEVMRADLYLDLMERVFGSDDISMLSDQRYRFDVDEVWREPGGIIFGGAGTAWRYEGCVFESMSRQNDATGDRVVRVTGTIRWTSRRRLR